MLVVVLVLSTGAKAQKSNGVLFLKKHNKTVKTWFPGTDIVVFTSGGGKVSGNIERITKDSLWLVYYQTAMVPTFAGTAVLDTLGRYPIHLAITELEAVPAIYRRRSILLNGTLYKLGGAAYLVVNAINTGREKQPYFGSDNIPRLVGGLAAIVVGFLLDKSKKEKFVVGKKYQIVASD